MLLIVMTVKQLKSQLHVEHEKYKHSLTVFKVAEESYHETVKAMTYSDAFINRKDPFYKSLVKDVHKTFSVCNTFAKNMHSLEIRIRRIDPNFIPISRKYFHCYIE
jgi:hypothetical protein